MSSITISYRFYHGNGTTAIGSGTRTIEVSPSKTDYIIEIQHTIPAASYQKQIKCVGYISSSNIPNINYDSTTYQVSTEAIGQRVINSSHTAMSGEAKGGSTVSVNVTPGSWTAPSTQPVCFDGSPATSVTATAGTPTYRWFVCNTKTHSDSTGSHTTKQPTSGFEWIDAEGSTTKKSFTIQNFTYGGKYIGCYINVPSAGATGFTGGQLSCYITSDFPIPQNSAVISDVSYDEADGLLVGDVIKATITV